MNFYRPLLFLVLLFAGKSTWAPAQTAAPDGAAANGQAAAPPTVQVVDVYGLSNSRHDSLQLGDQVRLRVRGLRAALNYYHRKPEELRLFVDEVAFPMTPEAGSVDMLRNSDTATVRFLLRRDQTTEPTWQLFYRVWHKLDHPAHIGIGFENGQLGDAFPPQGKHVYLELVRRHELEAGLAAIIALLGLLIFLGWHSNLVRSDVIRGNLDASAAAASDLIGEHYETVPFSLSKVQLLFWTFLIISAYLLCYLVTGELTALPISLLGLLGISLGSTLFSQTLTRSQVASAGPLTITTQSAGFWRDLLADQNRFSIPRIQFVLFNLLVGFYFIRHVWQVWNLPGLDEGLLALISISTTGFLAGKAQENPPPADGTAAKAPATTPPGASTTTTSTTTTSTTTTSTTTTSTTAALPAAPVPAAAVQPDGTPTRRDDEEDNSAPPATDGLPTAPPSSLGMG